MANLLQHQIIKRALEIISDETKWTRGAMARNAFGHSCSAWDQEAVRFCAVGAIYRAAFEMLGETLDSILIEITETCIPPPMASNTPAYPPSTIMRAGMRLKRCFRKHSPLKPACDSSLAHGASNVAGLLLRLRLKQRLTVSQWSFIVSASTGPFSS